LTHSDTGFPMPCVCLVVDALAFAEGLLLWEEYLARLPKLRTPDRAVPDADRPDRPPRTDAGA